jgi:dihydrofolate reductase (trimethoprim resistance protein)
MTHTTYKLGDTVRKRSGSQWHGTIVGTYSTSLTPEGYAVESATESGSVQIYPVAALEPWTPVSGTPEGLI